MISTICHTLGEVFPKHRIYREQVKQIKRPAFFVRNLETVQTKCIGNLYKRQCSFVIRCHLEEDALSNYEELTQIADKLYSSLEFMEFNGEKLRGCEMKHRIEDNVLQFFLTCRQSIKKQEIDSVMEELETELKEKG